MSTNPDHFGPGDMFPRRPRLYRKKTITEMVKMDRAFTCTNREGENLKGQPGDFLVADGHGGFYPVSAEFHQKNYELVEGEDVD